MVTTPQRLKDLLKIVIDRKGSDLHLSVGSTPEIRVDGELIPLGDKKLDKETCQKLCFEILDHDKTAQFEKNREFDLSIDFDENTRFRVNLFHQRGTVGGAFRLIPTTIPSPQELQIPESAMRLCSKPRGLILVTGPSGCGKTTTLAAMINQINETRKEHIITIEDPIEYLHSSKKSVIIQREVEKDTESFGAALKRILRQDPDVVLIGEMRDLETVAAAITVSETGHLVFATLHTNTADQTINRIIDVFPPHQQPQIRTQLSFVLEGILCQQLLAKKGGGRILAMEVLIPNIAIRNLIREDKVHQLRSTMQMDQAKTGMQTLNQALTELVKKDLITKEQAIGYATDQDEIKRLLGSK